MAEMKINNKKTGIDRGCGIQVEKDDCSKQRRILRK